MTQDSFSFIVLQEEPIIYNYCYERILNLIIFPLFTIWLNVFTIFILDYFGFKQDCMMLTDLCQILPMLTLCAPLIFIEITRKNLYIVFISIICSVTMSVILYFTININSWEDKDIPVGCDIVTEILKGTGSVLIGIFIQIMF
jgi:hypothetical protein